MGQVLRVLLVEDSEMDAALLLHELRRGYEVVAERVETPAAMAAALDRAEQAGAPWDLLISDNDLPRFSGIAALQLALARGLDLPLLIVSGREDEQTALAAMRAGAHDYFVKGHLDRLLPAIERELREAEQRRARRAAEAELQQAYYHTADILENISDAFVAVDRHWRITYVNRQAEAFWARRREDLLGKPLWQEFPQAAEGELQRQAARAARDRAAVEFETRSSTDGRWIRVNLSPNSTGLSIYFRDITARKAAEAERAYQATLLAQLNDAVVAADANLTVTAWNGAAESIYGWTAAEALGRPVSEVLQHEFRDAPWETVRAALDELGHLSGEAVHHDREGRAIHVEYRTTALKDAAGHVTGYVSVNRDISARKQAEQEKAALLKEREDERAYLQAVLNHLPCGVSIAQAPSGRLLYHNDEAVRLLRHPLLPADSYTDYSRYGAWHSPGHAYAPEEYPIARALWGEVVHEEEMVYRRGDGTLTAFSVSAVPVRNAAGEIIAAVSTFHDIAEHKHNADGLREARDRATRTAERMARLQAVTNRLSEALIPADVVDVIMEHAAPTLGVRGALVMLVQAPESGEAVLELARAVGYPEELVAEYRRVPLSAAQVTAHIIRARQPVWLESRAALEGVFPRLARAHSAQGYEAAAVLPLLASGQALGGLVFSFAEPRDFSADDQTFMLTLAQHCAQALERARLYEAEHCAHLELEDRVRARTAELQAANERLAAAVAERRRVEQHLERSREEERARIAREIHDELGGTLTAIKLEVAWVSRRLAEGKPAADLLPKVEALLELVTDTAQSVRRIATQLRPAVLDDLGLVAALEWLVQDFEARTGVRARLATTLEDVNIDGEQATGLFRILQEALTNVARHAQASCVRVVLAQEGGTLRLQVRDDGRGITAADLAKAGSSGLVGMYERARLLGAVLEVQGLPGRGTLVGVTLPLPSSAASATTRSLVIEAPAAG